MNVPLRIAFADDQALVRHGLRGVLEKFDDLEVVVDAEDGEALLKYLQRNRVDVIVTDVGMPKFTGLEVSRWLREHGDYTPILLLTVFEDPALLERAVNAGVQGLLLKDAEPEDLEHAIRRLAAGETVFAPAAMQRVRDGVPPEQEQAQERLTPRELSILRFVAGGYSNKEVARVLSISDGTVKNHMSDIMRKLEARDRTHAVLKAISKRFM